MLRIQQQKLIQYAKLYVKLSKKAQTMKSKSIVLQFSSLVLINF